MKSVTHLPALGTVIWAILHYGLPDKPTTPTYTDTYSVELAAVALLAIAASILVALRRMRP